MWARGSAAASASAGAGSLPVAGFGRGRGAPAPAAKAGGAAAGWSARDVARLGVFLALATALHIFEAQLPALPIPGAKIGLANLVSMFALYAWGFREALLIVVMRQLVGSLVTGTLFAPAFVFGLTGGVVSVAVMALVLRLAGALGPVAVSLMGATAHNVGQLLAAWAMLGQAQVFYYLPYLLWFAVPSGALVGVAAKRLLPFVSLAAGTDRAGAEAAGRRLFELKAAWLTGTVLVAIGAGLALSTLWQPAAVAHPQAKVTVNGEVYAVLPLEGEGRHELVLGSERMVIEYRDGRVRVAESTCRNQVCVGTGWIGHPREAIACVPFQVLITIVGQSPSDTAEPEYDALLY